MIINNEVCKAIPGFSRYVISEFGRIYRVVAITGRERRELDENPKKQYVRESKIQFYETKNRGRWTQVGLVNDQGKFATAAAEKLLCDAFALWTRKKKNFSIGFKDGNNKNMHVSNIELLPLKPNNSKLTLLQVKEIRKQIAKGTPLRQIAENYSVSDMQISRIKTGENWRKGGRLVPVPQPPFEVKDGRLRRFVGTFEFAEIDKNLRRPFTIKRTDKSTENKIIGIVNGYRLSKTHRNISRARALVYKLNLYFFNEEIAEKIDKKLQSKEENNQPIVL